MLIAELLSECASTTLPLTACVGAWRRQECFRSDYLCSGSYDSGGSNEPNTAGVEESSTTLCGNDALESKPTVNPRQTGL